MDLRLGKVEFRPHTLFALIVRDQFRRFIEKQIYEN